MAVYTKINSKDLLSLSRDYKLGKIIKSEGIKKGIENTNYLLKTNTKKFILTIFEKRVQKKDLPFFMNLMEKLNQKKIICPKPLKNSADKHLSKIQNKPASIVTFLKGKDKATLNYKNCFDIGKNIAKFHKVGTKIKLYRKNSMSINKLDGLTSSKDDLDKLQGITNGTAKESRAAGLIPRDKNLLNEEYRDLGLYFERNEYQSVVDIMVARKKKERERQSIMERGPAGSWNPLSGGFYVGAAKLAVGIGTSFLDPINIGASFIPI